MNTSLVQLQIMLDYVFIPRNFKYGLPRIIDFVDVEETEMYQRKDLLGKLNDSHDYMKDIFLN